MPARPPSGPRSILPPPSIVALGVRKTLLVELESLAPRLPVGLHLARDLQQACARLGEERVRGVLVGERAKSWDVEVLLAHAARRRLPLERCDDDDALVKLRTLATRLLRGDRETLA